MDNITHSLLGVALAKTRLGRLSPLAPAALVVAANLPDLENCVLALADRPTNMIHHRGFMHSALGIASLIPLSAALVYCLDNRLRRTGQRGSFWMFLVGIALAAGSHPLLDWLNTYGIRPWLPFDGRWYYGDLVYIVDPWLWLLLGAATCLAGRRTRAGSVVLGGLALLLTVVVLLAGGFAPLALQVIWPLSIVLLVLGRWRGLGQTRPHAVVAVALAAAGAYIGFLGWAGRTAWRMSQPVIAARLAPDETIIGHTTSPQPADPLRWQITAETQRAVYRHEFSILDAPAGVQRLAKHLDDPTLARLSESPGVRAWRTFARHPVAAVARYDGRRRVFLMDARYRLFPAPSFSSVVIDVPEQRPSGDR